MTHPPTPPTPTKARWTRQHKPSIILLSSTLLMLTWWYFAQPGFLAKHLPQSATASYDPQAAGAVGSFVLAFVLLGLIPALLVKLIFGEHLADCGVQLGNPLRTFRSMALFVPCFVLIGYLAARLPAFQQFYPLNPRAGDSLGAFALHAASYGLFYLGWEFHFRGFLQLGLRGALGDQGALMVQVLASTILHVGRPVAEPFGAIAAGLLWGVLAYRTRSLLSGLAQHYALGVALDWFICRVHA